MFNVGQEYTKKDIYKLLEVPIEKQRGDWDTGWHKYNDTWYIFTNVGNSARTGHDYDNHWNNNQLVWFARKNYSVTSNTIQDFLNGDITKHLFSRSNDRADWTYQGQAQAIEHEETNPIKIIWSFKNNENEKP